MNRAASSRSISRLLMSDRCSAGGSQELHRHLAINQIRVDSQTTPSGLRRVEYHDARNLGERGPFAVAYFRLSGEAVNPFRWVKPGMVDGDVKRILGSPFLDNRDSRCGAMTYMYCYAGVEIRFTAGRRVEEVSWYHRP